MKIFSSIVNKNIISDFPLKNATSFDLIQYATWKCEIDGILASAYLLCPDIVEARNYIFIKDFFTYSEADIDSVLNALERKYDYNRKLIEMSINSWSIGDLFIGSNNPLLDNDNMLIEFGTTLVYFWQKRVNEIFPDRNVVVELGYDIMGEYGLCITMYEECD